MHNMIMVAMHAISATAFDYERSSIAGSAACQAVLKSAATAVADIACMRGSCSMRGDPDLQAETEDAIDQRVALLETAEAVQQRRQHLCSVMHLPCNPHTRAWRSRDARQLAHGTDSQAARPGSAPQAAQCCLKSPMYDSRCATATSGPEQAWARELARDCCGRHVQTSGQPSDPPYIV